MEQHGVRAYLSFVGTGELVLLHVWPMDTVDDGVYWVGSDSSTVGLSGPAAPEFFRRSGLLLPSCLWRRRPSILHECFSSLLLRSLIASAFGRARRALQALTWTLPPLSSAAFWVGVHGQVGVQGQVGGLDFPVRGIVPVQLGPFMTLVSSVDLAGRKGTTLCFFGIACVCV